MQDRARLPRHKLLLLVIAGITAVGALFVAPDGAVEEMFARMASRMAGAGNLMLSAPKPLPPLAFLEEAKGRVTVVNFWALWCASCKVEKPKLDRLQADYAEKGLLVLTISDGGDDLAAVEDYFAEHGITHLKPMRDEGSVAFRTLGFRGVPSTIVLNAKGEEIARAEGIVDWDAKAVRQFLDQALAEASN